MVELNKFNVANKNSAFVSRKRNCIIARWWRAGKQNLFHVLCSFFWKNEKQENNNNKLAISIWLCDF